MWIAELYIARHKTWLPSGATYATTGLPLDRALAMTRGHMASLVRHESQAVPYRLRNLETGQTILMGTA